MKIKYFKYRDTGKVELERFHFPIDKGEADITYCCHDMKMFIDENFMEIQNVDPPWLSVKVNGGNEIRTSIVRFCPSCGEKIIPERVR